MGGDPTGPVVHVDDADDSVAPATGGGPSMEFLRDLAHVSDRAPGVYDLELAAVARAAGPEAAPASGRFTIRQRLGAGGFGTVYEALDTADQTTVALKVLRRRDGPSIGRFKREFRSLAETVHPNLVQLYELHVEGDQWLFTMELVRGVDALTYVRPVGAAVDLPRLRAVFRQLAGGLWFLHQAGTLHRDLKPSNVLVGDDGRVVIVDFGLALDIDERQPEGAAAGTPAYMPPEQAAGQAVGTAADWYAVGVMLFEALTGRLPGSVAAASPATVAAGVPDDLDRLCVDLLRRDVERRPGGAEVCRRLGASAAVGAGGGEPPFVGRTAQLATLQAALSTAAQGRAVAVFLHGRSGIGKTALLQRFLAEVRAREPDRMVLFGRCFEQESVPYKGVDGIVDELARRLRDRPAAELEAWLPADLPMLARLFPQLGGLAGVRLPIPVEGVDDPGLRKRAFAALGALIAAAAPPAPVLVVDDLQWGDLDGVALLAALLHGPAPALLVASYRDEDAPPNPVLRALFAALAVHVDVRQVEVGALDDREAEALALALVDADRPTGATVRALVAEARGDPFLLAELARHDPALARPEVAPELGALLAARIRGLPAPARRLLEVVAVEGQPIARAVAARAARGSEGDSDLRSAISVLRAARLLRSRRTDGGDELLPYHDRIREVVTDRLDADLRRHHHHQLALALEAVGGAEPERLLFHHLHAGRPADAARYAADAARRADRALAFERAARLYRQALALGGSDGMSGSRTAAADRALRVSLADALANAGRPREAAQAYLDAVAGAAPADTLALRTRAAELLLGAGYADEGLATLRGVLRDVGVTLATSLPRSLVGLAAIRLRLGVRGLALRERAESAIGARELLRVDACYAAAMGLYLVNPILAAESVSRHLWLALEVGEPSRAARAFALEALFQAHRRGPGPATERLFDAARAIEQRMSNHRLTGFLRLAEGMVAQVGARWRLVHDRMRESETALRRHGADISMELDLARRIRVQTLWMLGELPELVREAPALADEARERGNRFLEMMVRLGCGPLIALAEDRPDRAREVVAAALARWPHPRGSVLHVRELLTTARISLYEGRADVALATIEVGRSAIRRTGLVLARVQSLELRLLRALAALSAGDDHLATRDHRALAGSQVPWAQATAVIVEAGLARRKGDLDRAIALLRQALATAHDRDAALVAAALSRRLGHALGGDQGRALVVAADAWMTGRGIVDPDRTTALQLGWW